jgi:hypothetical protein
MIFSALGFPPCGSGQETCTNIGKRQLYTKGETIQKRRIHKKKRKQKCVVLASLN